MKRNTVAKIYKPKKKQKEYTQRKGQATTKQVKTILKNIKVKENE